MGIFYKNGKEYSSCIHTDVKELYEYMYGQDEELMRPESQDKEADDASVGNS